MASERTARRFLTAAAAFLAAAVLLVPGLSGAAVYDPALTWRTRTTAHFRIHYPEPLAAQAAALAAIAEEDYPTMTGLAGWQPEELTEIILVDNTDLANGMTTVYPYDRIILYAVAPEFFSSIADYNNWLRTVFVHEYAHVLGLDYRRGYAKIMQYIFGRPSYPFTLPSAVVWFLASPPNVFLPPWFHEGLAVQFESDLTGRGRKTSTYYNMIYRADVAADSIPPLDRLIGDFPEWPAYSTRYIYGAKLLTAVTDKYGDAGLGQLVRDHGGRFPYTIDRPPTVVMGQDYQGLYRAMCEGLKAVYGPEIEALKREGLTPFEPLTRLGYMAGGPAWLNDREIVYTRDDSYGPPALLLKNLETGETRRLAERPGELGRPAPDATGKIFFTRLAAFRPWAGPTYYGDLYSMAPGHFWAERLTDGARLRDVDVSLDGRIAAVQLDGPRQRLITLDAQGGDANILLEAPGMRYDHPRWSPDGSKIAFSAKTDAGTERLALLTAATGEVRLLTPPGARAGFPTWSPDGSRLAFSWDESGIFNLYTLDVGSGEIRRLTRLIGGAFWPDWSPDGKRLAFVNYASEGFDLALLRLEDALNLPVVAQGRASAPGAVAEEASPARKVETQTGRDSAYEGADRLIPSSWLPDVLADNAGLAFGAWTAATDPLQEQAYYAAGFWSPGLHRFYGLGAYVYDGWYPTLTVFGSKLPVAYADLLDGRDYWEENRQVGVEARQTLWGVLRNVSASASWAWEDVGRISRVEEDLDGRADLADLAFQGRQNPLKFALAYDSTFPYDTGFTLGPEAGRLVEVEARVRDDFTGSERTSRELVGKWLEYFLLPVRDRTVLSFKARGAVGHGEETLQSLFQAGGTASEFPIRGYKERAIRAERLAVGTVELKTPLWSPYRGVQDWPAFLNRVTAAAFFDAGRSFGTEDEDWRRGAGVEARAATLLGYYFPLTITVGYAHGFDEGGGDRGYFLVTIGGEETVGISR